MDAAVLVARVAVTQVPKGPEGTRNASSAHEKCVDWLSETIVHAGGRVVRRGSQIVTAQFDAADPAVEAAIAMQRGIHGERGELNHGIAIAIGVHFGHVEEASGNLAGAAVLLATRLCNAARAPQILAVRDLVLALSPMRKAMARRIHTDLGETNGTRPEVFELIWIDQIDGPGTTWDPKNQRFF